MYLQISKTTWLFLGVLVIGGYAMCRFFMDAMQMVM
jgi:hypothetical protein